jgi:dipeptidase E
MKLLLTSAGLTNTSISKALFDLVGKKPEDTVLVFVPTASNFEQGDKEWVINDLVNIQKQGFKEVRIADISAVPESIWLPQFEAADILFFCGGNTFHLMEWINKSGLAKHLPRLLKTKVWAGISAGTMVTNPGLLLKLSQVVYDEDFDRTQDMPGLNLVDFYVLPHLDSPYFTKLREPLIREAAKDIKKKVYVLDDESALKVIDEKVEIVNEGKWFEIN